MAKTRVVILNETSKKGQEGWNLYFQYCRYEYGSGYVNNGYRFIWKRPNGTLQAARGQARIPSIADILELSATAISEGWGCFSDTSISHEDDDDE